MLRGFSGFSSKSVILRSLSVIMIPKRFASSIYNSVIGCGVTVGEGTVIRDSIIMNETRIGSHCELHKAIVAENTVIEDDVRLGIGEEAENETDPHIYNSGIVAVGEKSFIPQGVTVGKNSVVFGVTSAQDYAEYISEPSPIILRSTILSEPRYCGGNISLFV